MSKKTITIYPSAAKELISLGQRLRDARLRRRFSMETVCVRADISRPTLYKAEKRRPIRCHGYLCADTASLRVGGRFGAAGQGRSAGQATPG